MPGPLPDYPTRAARQRAYRQRQRAALAESEREAELTSVYAHVLHAAVKQACAQDTAGVVAREVYRSDPFETLRALADHFYDLAQVPRAQRPWFDEAAEGTPPPAPPNSPALPDSRAKEDAL